VREPLRLPKPTDPIPEIEFLGVVMAFQDVSNVEVFYEAVPWRAFGTFVA